MTAARVLVVNADDFGRTSGVNRGIIEAHERGIVTDATLMVRWPAAEDAAAYARRRPELGVGLHLDLAEWEYTDGAWKPLYEVIDTDDQAAVEDELDRQLGCFLRLVGRPPTHLDSHQHVHRQEPVRSVLARAGRMLGIPVRDVTPGIRYCGSFYGQDGRGWPVPEAITVDALVALIRDLPAGITELGCHPGDPVDLDNVYRAERAAEVRALCHSRIRGAIVEQGIRLVSFRELAHATGPLPSSRGTRVESDRDSSACAVMQAAGAIPGQHDAVSEREADAFQISGSPVESPPGEHVEPADPADDGGPS